MTKMKMKMKTQTTTSNKPTLLHQLKSLNYGKLILIFIFLIIMSKSGFAQNVGIGTLTPDASAMLDVSSTDRGFLVPRMDQAQRNAISSPVEGLLIYQTDNSAGFYHFNGASWEKLSTDSNNKWTTTGNTGTVNGTNFLGTTDDQAVDIRTNDVIRIRITTKGQIEVLNTGSSVFLGEGAGDNDDLSDNKNTFLGHESGNRNTTGQENTAAGHHAMYYNNTGEKNTANGRQALYSNTLGNRNIANGLMSLYSNTEGHQNTASGFKSLDSYPCDL